MGVATGAAIGSVVPGLGTLIGGGCRWTYCQGSIRVKVYRYRMILAMSK